MTDLGKRKKLIRRRSSLNENMVELVETQISNATPGLIISRSTAVDVFYGFNEKTVFWKYYLFLSSYVCTFHRSLPIKKNALIFVAHFWRAKENFAFRVLKGLYTPTFTVLFDLVTLRTEVKALLVTQQVGDIRAQICVMSQKNIGPFMNYDQSPM